MNNIKLQKGIYRKTGRNTYEGKNGVLLELAPNRSDGFSLLVVSGSGNCPIFELVKTQNRDVFEINTVKERLFLEMYIDKVEIRS